MLCYLFQMLILILTIKSSFIQHIKMQTFKEISNTNNLDCWKKHGHWSNAKQVNISPIMANIFKLLVTASLIDMPHFLPQKLMLLAIFHIYSQNIVLIENSTAWSWRLKKFLCTCQWFWCIKDTLSNKNCTAPGTSVILHFILSMNIVCMSMSS